ncbi:type II secretion system protein N [Glaciimonas sp. PAMC28666]|uniref:type II secretion system protein N n=1 Tax=Glaciimonas sp. PAMC28666 TaxID=2807626 RepID=UPI0019649006|nr:type II secretion system protein N [Glaciimonas sp. PAMC28666]QRX82382.1 type II secretion system protein N [Glaciimonas sp. PAMC28666]
MSNFHRTFCWIGAALLSMLITTMVFLPAAWLAPLMERTTAGRFVLGDTQGTLWSGSAVIGVPMHDAADGNTIMPLIPGRMVWRFSPGVLFGRIAMSIDNSLVLSQPIHVRGNWRAWGITAASLSMPARQLVALGAPWNTLQPSGQITFSWQPLHIAKAERDPNGMDINGEMSVELAALASPLSQVKPLGSYRLQFSWERQHAALTLTTLDSFTAATAPSNAMLLEGKGTLENGHLQFAGTAQAAEGQENKLAGVLSFLGQPSRINGKNVIELAFKS